eukprot:283447_1
MAADAFSHRYKINDPLRVLYHDNEFYDGRIIDIDQNRIKISYNGYNEKYDEWIHTSDSRLFTQTNDNQTSEQQPQEIKNKIETTHTSQSDKQSHPGYIEMITQAIKSLNGYGT